MNAGPTAYARLMDFACNQPRIDIEKRLIESAREDAAAVSSLLIRAYQEGLRDGFQQGVQAVAEET